MDYIVHRNEVTRIYFLELLNHINILGRGIERKISLSVNQQSPGTKPIKSPGSFRVAGIDPRRDLTQVPAFIRVGPDEKQGFNLWHGSDVLHDEISNFIGDVWLWHAWSAYRDREGFPEAGRIGTHKRSEPPLRLNGDGPDCLPSLRRATPRLRSTSIASHRSPLIHADRFSSNIGLPIPPTRPWQNVTRARNRRLSDFRAFLLPVFFTYSVLSQFRIRPGWESCRSGPPERSGCENRCCRPGKSLSISVARLLPLVRSDAAFAPNKDCNRTRIDSRLVCHQTFQIPRLAVTIRKAGSHDMCELRYGSLVQMNSTVTNPMRTTADIRAWFRRSELEIPRL